MAKKTARRKPRVKVYPAPRKSAASYFFASFFLTLTVALCGAGFLIAYDHSVSVGSGRSVTAFAVSQKGGLIDFTVAGNSFFVNTVSFDEAQIVFKKIRMVGTGFEPAPVGLAKLVTARFDVFEEKLLARYDPFKI
jgi:hypothetical protein